MTSSPKPNYDEYSLAELYQAKTSIDREKDPIGYNEICTRIKLRNSTKPNYDEYNLAELYQAKATVNKEKYPERYNEIIAKIKEKKSIIPLLTRDDTNSETLNPWIWIWVKPKKTIQQIVDTNPEKMVLILAALSGIYQSLNYARDNNLGDTQGLLSILLNAILLGPLGGIISLYLGAGLIKWTGKWFDGQGTAVKIRAALAWSSVPTAWLLLLSIPRLALFGHELFTSSTSIISLSPFLVNFLFGIAWIEIIISIWQVFISLHCLAQVQDFSAWTALSNFVLAFLVIIGPILMFLIALSLI